MVEVSVLIPERGSAEVVLDELPDLCRVLEEHGKTYEIIVIDDGSAAATLRLLRSVMNQFPTVRVLRFATPVGTSAALTAGVQAARGPQIVAMQAGRRYRAGQIVDLLMHLSRADLVVGRPQRRGLAKLWHRVARIPRWLLLGLDVRDAGCLFWAARREAVAGIELVRGMCRYLPTLCAARGWRVIEVSVQRGPGDQRTCFDAWPNPGDMFVAWWLKRRVTTATPHELNGDETPDGRARIARIDAAQPTPGRPQVRAHAARGC